ncbi:MAG TPA: LarC family nickel insertion protein, partial [Actinomycetota bacterium]|nr:LarC family nickel insertion protein [Actinomycetota bacterium]
RTRAGGAGEIVTPTAAAILAALGASTDSFPEMTIGSIGYGAGTKDPPDRPNLMRVVVGSRAAQGAQARELVVMEANIDDLTPELMADAVQALFAAGALDAWTTPIQMKKGRPGILLSAIGEPGAEPRLRTTFFEATSTFGVRSHRVTRAELERRIATVELTDGSVRVKVGLLQGRVVTATPEHDDVAALAARAGRPVRRVYEEAAAAARALRYAESDR